MMSDGKTGQWHTIEMLEDDEAVPETQRKEFSYPYLLSADGGVHLVYTWDRKRIRHRYFSDAWLKQAYSHALLIEEEASNKESAQ